MNRRHRIVRLFISFETRLDSEALVRLRSNGLFESRGNKLVASGVSCRPTPTVPCTSIATRANEKKKLGSALLHVFGIWALACLLWLTGVFSSGDRAPPARVPMIQYPESACFSRSTISPARPHVLFAFSDELENYIWWNKVVSFEAQIAHTCSL